MITMSDIAQEAGVSRATVSLVLNNKHASVGIPESTCRRVLEAADQLGYRPNETARTMVTGKSRVIAYLVQDPSHEVAARILAGALNEAEQHGYLIKLVGREDKLDRRHIERCVELRPVGVMALHIPPPMDEYLRTEMERYSIPFVLMDSSFPLNGMSRVLTNDQDGVWQGIEHLYNLGHRRIAHIAGPGYSGAAALREEGYRAAMQRLGLAVPEDYVAYGNWLIPETIAATEQLLLRTDPRPTAIFCADDKMAFTAIRIADRLGVKVPRDLSILGFADLEMARYGNPTLTTVAQPFGEVGRMAVRNLLEASKGPERKEEIGIQEVLLTNKLIVRESTAVPPQIEA